MIFPADKPYTGDYDYDADSDLEEDEDCNFSDDGDTQLPPVDLKSDWSTLVSSQIPEAKGDESPDIISISDMDSLFSEPVNTKLNPRQPPLPPPPMSELSLSSRMPLL